VKKLLPAESVLAPVAPAGARAGRKNPAPPGTQLALPPSNEPYKEPFMKTAFALILALALPALPALADCGSQTTSCYDYCESGYVPVAGDTCDTEYDYSRSCYKAVGSCSSGGGGESSCEGQSTDCYDYCTSSYVRLENANSCTTSYNYVKSCYQAVGICSR
jgi:hypothetical protein